MSFSGRQTGSRSRGRSRPVSNSKTATGRGRSRPSSNSKSREPEYADSMYITPQEARRISRGHAAHPADCICTICKCGAHKCPPDRVQGRYKNLQSSYMHDFQGDYVAPERVTRPQFVHKPRPFDGVTTSQQDYQYQGNQPRRKLCLKADNGLGSQGLPFEGLTTNQHDYRKWNSKPAEPAIKQNSRANILPDGRNFETEFSGQFVPKGGAQRRNRAPTNARTASVPFEGETTAQADFKEWNSRPAMSFQHIPSYRPRPDDRNFLTEGRAEYNEKPFDVCPAVDVAISSKPANGHVMVERCGDRWCHKDHPNEWE